MKKIRYLILIIVLVLVFWRFLFPGNRVANDFPLISREALIDRFDIPRLWTVKGAVGLGEYSLSTLWNWPLDFLYGIGGFIGIPFSILEIILGIFLFFVIGIISINKLLIYLEVKKTGQFIGTLVYFLNTYVLLLIDGGQFSIALAYAWFPLSYLWIIKSLQSDISGKLLAGLGLSLLGYFDIRFVYVLFVLLFIKVVYEFVFINYKYWIGEFSIWIRSGLVIGIVFAGMHAYWIIPAFFARTPDLPSGYGDVSQTSFLSLATLGHSLLLLQPHWYKNVFGKVISLQPQFYLIPILVFVAPLLVRVLKTSHYVRRVNKEIVFWLLVALTGVFLVKGSLEPWESFYPFLFKNVPGMSMFRDPTKFFFLIALAYTVLVGFTVSFISERFKWFVSIHKWKIEIIPLLLTIYFLILVYPVWGGKMTGTFSEPYNKDSFLYAAEIIKNEPEFGRVLWIPSRPPLGYSSPQHPTLEASRIVQLRPFAIGTVGTYEVFNFLREAPYMGELMNIAGVKYIVYPYPDERREELKEDNIEYYHAFLNQLSNLPWIEEKVSESPVPVLKTNESQDHFFIADNTFAVVGSDRIYTELTNIDGFRLSKNALIFIEEEKQLTGDFLKANDLPIIAYDKQELDLKINAIEDTKFIFPSEALGYSPDKSGWWKRESSDLISWRDFLQQKYGLDNLDLYYGGGLAVSEGNNQLEINQHQFNKNDLLFARVMKSSIGGEISFSQNNEAIGEIDTQMEDTEKVQISLTGYGEIPNQVFEYDKAEFAWLEVGKLQTDNSSIIINTTGEINVINAIAIIPESEWINFESSELSKFTERLSRWDDISDTQKSELVASRQNPIINYDRINPTHYRVTVKGITKPSTLVFSETYDPLWRLSPVGSEEEIRDPYPVYSLVNGFLIDKDGEYEIYFSAQKYVLPGLVISIVTLLISSSIILLKRKK